MSRVLVLFFVVHSRKREAAVKGRMLGMIIVKKLGPIAQLVRALDS